MALAVPNKRRKTVYLEDRISELPEELLVSILSLLTAKEAGRTSVLSRRWRYLWTFIVSLHFEDPTSRSKAALPGSGLKGLEGELLKVERSRFVEGVNQALKLHKAQSIDKFKIRIDNEESYKCDIEHWINFSLERKVKSLELDLYFYAPHEKGNYTLTHEFIRNYSLASLTTLQLDCVDLPGQVLEHILSRCSLLEVLIVYFARSPPNLQVSSSSLKCLEIIGGDYLDIEISAPNLVCFKYAGPEINLSLKNAPRLVEASFGGPYAHYLLTYSSRCSYLFSQLQTLVLEAECVKKFRPFPRFPELRNLKQLELVLTRFGFNSLHYMSLLQSFPMLHKLVLKLDRLLEGPIGMRNVKNVKPPHKHLKVVELVGFVGCKIDTEIVQYIIKKAVALEKLVINPNAVLRYFNKDYLKRQVWGYQERQIETKDYLEWQVEARASARQLETILPQGTELVIL